MENKTPTELQRSILEEAIIKAIEEYKNKTGISVSRIEIITHMVCKSILLFDIDDNLVYP